MTKSHAETTTHDFAALTTTHRAWPRIVPPFLDSTREMTRFHARDRARQS